MISSRFLTTRSMSSLGRALVFSELGNPAEVVKAKDIPISKLYKEGPNLVKCRILAASLNPADVNQIQGTYPLKPNFNLDIGDGSKYAIGGNEGVVEIEDLSNVDPALANDFAVGDHAIMQSPGYGLWRTHASLPIDKLIKVSKSLTPREASTLSVNPSTAHRMLSDFVKMRPGDYFIQNAANSAVGKAAIQIAKIRGFSSINIIRHRDNCHELDELKAELNDLGATIVMTDKELLDRSVAASKIGEIASSDRIVLGLNATCGPIGTEMIRYLAKNGHYVTYGAMSQKPITLGAGSLIFKNHTFHGFWVSKFNLENPEKQKETLKEILSWVENKKLKVGDAEGYSIFRESIVDNLFDKDTGFRGFQLKPVIEMINY